MNLLDANPLAEELKHRSQLTDEQTAEAIIARDTAIREIAVDLAILTGDKLPLEIRPILTTLAYCATLPLCKAAVVETTRSLEIDVQDKVALAVAVLRARLRFKCRVPEASVEDWSEWMDTL